MSGLLGPRPLRPGEVGRLEALYEAVYGAVWPQKTCFPRYLGATAWPGSVSVMEGDGRLVGAQPAYDVPLWVSGRPGIATILVDVVTHPAYRRRGIFSSLVDHAVRLGSDRGSCVALTTPNALSLPGFRKKPDWVLLLTLRCWLRVLSARRVLEHGLHVPAGLARIVAPLAQWVTAGRVVPAVDGGRSLESRRPDDLEIDDLWQRSAPAAHIMQRRDAAWVRHRFEGVVEGVRYRWLGAWQDGRLAGYLVVGLKQVRGLKVALLVDWLPADAVADCLGTLAALALEQARADGADIVLCYTVEHGGVRHWLARAGFRHVPGLLARRPYHVCARAIWREPARVLDASAWWMSLADSDLA